MLFHDIIPFDTSISVFVTPRRPSASPSGKILTSLIRPQWLQSWYHFMHIHGYQIQVDTNVSVKSIGNATSCSTTISLYPYIDIVYGVPDLSTAM